MESQEPSVFPVTIAAVNDIDRKAFRKKRKLSRDGKSPPRHVLRENLSVFRCPFPRNLDPVTTRKKALFVKLYQIPGYKYRDEIE